jgi:hypothetical protein
VRQLRGGLPVGGVKTGQDRKGDGATGGLHQPLQNTGREETISDGDDGGEGVQ